jgi:pimeloyl-ACP methyl ester carboxylesterase
VPALHLARAGRGPRLVFVHGAIGAGWEAWDAQRPLAERFELVVLWRSGYAPNQPLERLEIDAQAAEVASLLQPGDHLVAHSHGAVVALAAAARVAPMLASLVLVEPPAFGLVHDHPAVREFEDGVRGELAGVVEPLAYLRTFLTHMGVPEAELPDALPPVFEDRVRTFMREEWPGEARPELEPIVAAGLPVLVVSGGWHPAFDAVCDLLERELGAERVVLPGYGHSIPELGPPFNETLAAFVDGVERGIATAVDAGEADPG